ncbi:MAG: hypothetical protein ACREH8_22665, partial [Opitutaceae bacterium]
TLDAQAGFKMFALRVNAVKGDTRFFRPGLRQQNAGYHLAATFQPWKRLQIRGEYRDFSRDTIFAQDVTVRAPLDLLLPDGRPVDNQNSRLLVAFPETIKLLGGVFDITKADSAIGPFHRDAYFNKLKSVVAEVALTEGLALQVRYGHDARLNDALRASSIVAYAPGAPGNNYVDPATGLVGTQWAFNTSMGGNPFGTGARGYRAALAYQKDFRRWGRHQASVFYQDMESWTNSDAYWTFYEADASGNVIQDPANVTAAGAGRIPMPSVWLPIFPSQAIGGRDWKFDTVQHPNGKTYLYQPSTYAAAVPKTFRNPLGFSGPVNATGNLAGTTFAGQSSTGLFLDDTDETSYGFSLFSEWWGGRIDTMAGYRAEEASGYRIHNNVSRGPITYDSLTAGTVFDTPIKGLRVSASYSSNAKINFDTTRDIFNQTLPAGKGETRDIGLKFG